MIEQIREMGRLALIEGLASRLSGVEWGSPTMAVAVNTYIVSLGRTAGAAVLVRLSPLIDLGLDVADGATSAAQLAALQGLTTQEFGEVIVKAWKQANDEDPPNQEGYRHFLGEVTLEALRRLNPRRA